MFAVLVLDLHDEALGVSSMALVTAFIIGVDGFWWWALFIRRGGEADRGSDPRLIEFMLWQSLILVGVIAGFWLFGPMTAGYPEQMRIWIAMVLAPTVILIARMAWWFSR